MSAYLNSANNFTNHVEGNLAQGEILPETGFMDAFNASLGLFIDENLSISKYINGGAHRDRNQSIHKMLADGDIPSDIASAYVQKTTRGNKVDYDGLAAYANDNLNAEFLSGAEIDESIRDTLKMRRDYTERVLQNTSVSGTIGQIAGGFVGVGMDPVNVLSFLAVPYRSMQGVSVLQNVIRAGAKEAAIGAAAETAIQPFVLDWKAEIQAPYSPVEAIQNIGYAAGFGFALGGIQGGIGAVRGRNTNQVVEQDYKISDHEKVLDDIINEAEANIDLVNADPAARSSLNDIKELREEVREGAPDGDISASEHYSRINKELERQADDSPRYEPTNFDEFDDTRLDLELQELGDVEIPLRMETEETGIRKFETERISEIVAKADEQDSRLRALKECILG